MKGTIAEMSMQSLHDGVDRSPVGITHGTRREHYLRDDGRTVELVHIETRPSGELCLVELDDGTRRLVATSELASRPVVAACS